MQKLKNFLTHPVTISLIGLIAISLLIWFVGPQIKFGENNNAPLASVTVRLICIMVALVLWGLNNLWIQARNKKTNNELLAGLQESKESLQQSGGGFSEQTAEEMFQINERFNQALDTLRRYKFKGARGNRALYELPWYIIVGPPGSGKTTALINSGLEFPLAETFGRGSLQGVGGTRNCDWWFTNEAVLIDTAGRYTTQDSHKAVDASAWEGFLELLRRNRRRRPINGAVVAISLQDLLMQTEDERAMQAKTIRARLDELMDKLQIRFPVYLVFTKADLVSGFSEFFEDFSREEREQVWGISLPDAPQADSAPDFDFLRNELTSLTRNLYARVLWRMHQERDSKRRAAIQGFPQQFENLRGIAEQFVRQTFAFNRFKFQPYLRGVYFTSGTQDGTPIDRLMASVAANFGFARDVAQLPHQQGKSFFLGRLFREVIFPEGELVGSNVSYERTIRWLQRGAYALMLLALVGLTMVWSGSVMRHRGFMKEVNAHVEEYELAADKVAAQNRDVRQVLPPLAALEQASLVYDQQDHPWLTSLGLYDVRVDAKADDAYRHELETELLPRLLYTMETELTKGYEGRDLYDTFRIYMMFQKTDRMETERVREWFVSHWDTALRGEGTKRKELEAHLDNLLAQVPPPSTLNARLVKDTRELILREPVAQRVYSRVRSNPLYNRKVDLLAAFGAPVRTSYKIDSDVQRALFIPVMFTKEGYDSIDLSPDSPLVADIVNERWVLTDDENAKIDFIQEDLDDVSRQVEDLYLSEYIQVWDEVYKQLIVAEFRNLRHAEEVLANLVDPVYSPLASILQVGQRNTQLRPPKDDIEDLAAKNPKKGGRVAQIATAALVDQYEGTRVDKHFRDLNALVAEGRGDVAPVATIMDKLQGLKDFMTDVAISPEPGQQAFNHSRARFDTSAGNAITDVRAYSQSLPEPVRQWLTTLADQSWKVLLDSARGYVDNEWRALVHRPYSQTLQGRYPLNRSSSDEMALYDFSEFFKPGGTMDTFFNEYMAPFVSSRGGMRNRVVDNYTLGFSEEVLRQVNNARAIKDIFYRESPDSIAVTMELRPRAMEERDARFTLDVGEERLTYNHGPKFWKTVRWQANQDNMRVRMVFEDLQGSQYERTFQGGWAWFRLLDSSYVEKTSQSNIYLVTFSAGDERAGGQRDAHKITYEVKTKSADSPLRREVLSAFRAPESIVP